MSRDYPEDETKTLNHAPEQRPLEGSGDVNFCFPSPLILQLRVLGAPKLGAKYSLNPEEW